MPKKYKVKDVDRSELHIIHYLNDSDYKLRMLTCNHPVPPDRCIKLTWLRNLKENLELTDEISIQRYVRCHIMLLIGTILFGDKSGAGYSWGSACLAHLYRALCRASRYNCKEIDGPLTLLLGWAWIRLPYLSPLPREPRSFPLANRIHDIFLARSELIFSQITPLSSSNEIIKGITRSSGFSQINFTPSLVCNKI
ncbi:hypothetical protein Ahy_B05g078437 [Arachis hypogaea]|uniref:Aminotransferase-like plant mobile domain-containing protein n=1 Tax=Arachis hypogaea TaxID=3818 RepID=A0A444Z753_ARAHY|nr:hypothetical protein Ahy_B05g078437 [Arachis hypogaea]